MYNCIIIDDNQEAINVLVSHIKLRKDLNLIQTFLSPFEALHFLESNKIDLIFCDVEMPDLTGIEFIECLKEKRGIIYPKIILATGHTDYAVAGFESGVSDYLLKPITSKRFNISIDRLLSNQSIPKSETEEAYFFADVDGRKQKINFKDIAYIEGTGNYITIVGLGYKKLIYKTLSSILEILPEAEFIRIHRSFIISVIHLDAIKGDEAFIKLVDELKRLPIGTTYKEAILAKLKI